MARSSVKYAVIDAFTSIPFKGNPAAVCFLENDNDYDDEWMLSVAKEFNISVTAFLTRTKVNCDFKHPRFDLRWFTPVAEIELCGHGTIAAAHFLLSSSITNGDVIDFVTKSGILAAKKVCGLKQSGMADSSSSDTGEVFSIELDFPVMTIGECDPKEIPSIPATLNGLSVINVLKTTTRGNLVELSSGEDVANVQPNFSEIEKCAGMGLIITAPAPPGSGFDIFSRFFWPKFGINEDPVCGSAHCAIAPYWSKKLGEEKSNCLHGFSKGWEIGPANRRGNTTSAHQRQSSHRYGWYFVGLVAFPALFNKDNRDNNSSCLYSDCSPNTRSSKWNKEVSHAIY